MNRERHSRRGVLALAGMLTLGGCLGESSDTGTDSGNEGNATNDVFSQDNETNETTEDKDSIEERDAPEPEGGDGRPFTHYDLAVDAEHENGYPTWIDGNGRMYGRDGTRVMVSDDVCSRLVQQSACNDGSNVAQGSNHLLFRGPDGLYRPIRRPELTAGDWTALASTGPPQENPCSGAPNS